MKRPSINIAPAERVARVVLGLAGAIVGVMLIASADSAWTTILSIALAALGVDMVVTGALGHCPLYSKLGHVPASLRRST